MALDDGCDRVVARLADKAWAGDIQRADLVVMVVKAGSDAPDAGRIGRICSDRRITTATFVVDAAQVSDEALSRTLAQVRPWSLMVVISNEDDYVEEIVRSFR